MHITLTDDRGHIFAKVNSWEEANAAALAIFRRQNWSDLYYNIFFSPDAKIVNVSGAIDLEPASFHRPHQREIITTHLRTWWGNISRRAADWQFTQDDIEECKILLTYLPKA